MKYKAHYPKFQEALDRFMENPYWRSIYDAAPENVKKSEEIVYYISLKEDEMSDEEEAEIDRIRNEIHSSFSKEDWLYSADTAIHPKQREWFMKKAEECDK